jgi:divalent metal cation (Fe/Co/Zn/Cd) transporter
MPLLDCAKHKLAARLGSAATAGEGTQNYVYAAQAAAVLAVLAITAAWPGGWRIDPVIGPGVAAVAAREGIRSCTATTAADRDTPRGHGRHRRA